ncbi:hypothetical protein INR49_005808 [Caranx melampygus]|nr:hypothetical protein INR49_005808 [Caranx melampygus]
MTKAERQQLIDDHFLFDNPVAPLVLASGMARDCPTPGASGEASLSCHAQRQQDIPGVGERGPPACDSMQKGGNMKEVFQRFCTDAPRLRISSRREATPSCGTSTLATSSPAHPTWAPACVRVLHVKLPTMSKHAKFEEVLKRLRLQNVEQVQEPGRCFVLAADPAEHQHCVFNCCVFTGTISERIFPVGSTDLRPVFNLCSVLNRRRGNAVVGGVCDISNANRLGFSEVELVQMVVDGTKLLIKMERELEKGQSIDDMMPAETHSQR